MSRAAIVATSILLLQSIGCGDQAMRRGLELDQLVSINDRSHRFDVDVSAIPSTWIEERTIEHHSWGEEVRIRLARHPVKVVLVPADGNIPTTRPVDQRR